MKKQLLLTTLTATFILNGCSTTQPSVETIIKNDLGINRNNTLVFVSDKKTIYFDINSRCTNSAVIKNNIDYEYKYKTTYISAVKVNKAQYIHNIKVSDPTAYDINLTPETITTKISGNACIKSDKTLELNYTYKDKYLANITREHINGDFYLEKPHYQDINIKQGIVLKSNILTIINKVKYPTKNPFSTKTNNVYLYWHLR